MNKKKIRAAKRNIERQKIYDKLRNFALMITAYEGATYDGYSFYTDDGRPMVSPEVIEGEILALLNRLPAHDPIRQAYEEGASDE